MFLDSKFNFFCEVIDFASCNAWKVVFLCMQVLYSVNIIECEEGRTSNQTWWPRLQRG